GALQDVGQGGSLGGIEVGVQDGVEHALLVLDDTRAPRTALRALERLVVELFQLLAREELLVERIACREAERQVVDQRTLLGLEDELDSTLADHLRRALPLRDDVV